MIHADDVKRLIRFYKEHEYDLHHVPSDLRRLTAYTLEAMLKELEAAKNDLHVLHVENMGCKVCKNYNGGLYQPCCSGCNALDYFRWRGVEE